MKALFALLTVLVALSSSGCATQVHQDYPTYLANNEGRVNYPHVGRPAQYYLDQATANHSVEIKSWVTGIANSWTVQFGEVLEATMQGRDMQASFESLSRTDNNKDTAELMLLFHLSNYRFENFQAYIDMTVAAQSHGDQLFSKRYTANGKSQGGKMFWGGAFAMKNAVQQSTKLALDKILTSLLNDLNQALRSNVTSASTGATSSPARTSNRWIGDGARDACGASWAMDLSLSSGFVTGTLWRDEVAYDVRGDLDRAGQMKDGMGAKERSYAHVPAPRFLTLQLTFRGDTADGSYAINAAGSLSCATRVVLKPF